MSSNRDDAGSAIVEFSWLALLLMVPLVYLIVAVFRVQDGAYGVTAAARDAGRAFVTAADSGTGDSRARSAAEIVLADHHLALGDGDLTITCSSSPCLTPGASVTVSISAAVRIPLVPNLFGGGPPSVAVSATHLEVVDPYSTTRP